MLVGVLVALILNSYMPKNEEKIKEDIDYISEKIKEIFMDMAYSLRTHSVSIKEQRLFDELENRIELAKKEPMIILITICFQMLSTMCIT